MKLIQLLNLLGNKQKILINYTAIDEKYVLFDGRQREVPILLEQKEVLHIESDKHNVLKVEIAI